MSDAKDIAVAALTAAAGAAVSRFLDDEPEIGTKVKGAAELLKMAIDMLPEDELHADLTDLGAFRAQLALAVALAAKSQG